MASTGSKTVESLVASALFFFFAQVVRGDAQSSAALVPAILTFGDSTVDVGNNDYHATIFRANFPPYGRDFKDHEPTGRFCNGKLATDITAETLGFTSYPPAYLSPQASGKNLLIGANFASAASGFYDETAYFYDLYGLGARKIGVTSLPPLGCLPASITLFGHGSSECVRRLNSDAQSFNKKIDAAAKSLAKQLPGLKITIFDIYKPLHDLVTKPSKFGRSCSWLNHHVHCCRRTNFRFSKLLGFFEVRRGCCGSGMVETSLLCNQYSIGTCTNATGYVFWDSVHPSETANQVIADALVAQGINLIL
ncbi:hypothetical protein BHM03_00005869 [Ensete ventricosum]|nr:hypothetical protein BHM03_00005869 [Ensete ventricosum]